MIAVISLAINLIALAVIVWIAVMFYFTYENYRKGQDFCITKQVIEETGNVFNNMYKMTKGEAFEEKELVPYQLEETEEDDEENYNDVLLSQLEPTILQQHAEYVADSNHSTRGASTQVERSNREDVVPQWGLRRINYGADILSKNATTVPSFEYSGKTEQTNFNQIVGL